MYQHFVHVKYLAIQVSRFKLNLITKKFKVGMNKWFILMKFKLKFSVFYLKISYNWCFGGVFSFFFFAGATFFRFDL